MYYTTFNQVSGNFVQRTFFVSCLHGKIGKSFDSGVLSGMLLVDLQKHLIFQLKEAFSRLYWWNNQVILMIFLKKKVYFQYRKHIFGIDNLWSNTRLNFGSTAFYNWLVVDNKLSIHFDEDKAKPFLFSPKDRWKTIAQIDISFKDIKNKQYLKATYLRCVLDKCQTVESMVMQICTKTTSKLKFLYRKNRFLVERRKEAFMQRTYSTTLKYWFKRKSSVTNVIKTNMSHHNMRN